MKNYYSNKYFSMWDYGVSHDQLLFRHEEGSFNIDIIFFGVFFMHIKPIYKDFSIRLANANDINNLSIDESLKEYEKEKFYIIETKNSVGYIGALNFGVYKNTLHHTESSLGVIVFKGRDNLIFEF